MLNHGVFSKIKKFEDRLPITQFSQMSTFSDSLKEFINVASLAAKIRSLGAELALLKQLQSSLGVKTRGRKVGKARFRILEDEAVSKDSQLYAEKLIHEGFEAAKWSFRLIKPSF
jgi:hypothetical protein